MPRHGHLLQRAIRLLLHKRPQRSRHLLLSHLQLRLRATLVDSRLNRACGRTKPQPVVQRAPADAEHLVSRHLAHPAIQGGQSTLPKVLTVSSSHNHKCSLSHHDGYRIQATMSVRPDFSDYVVHFTKDSAPYSAAYAKTDGFKQRIDTIAAMSARDRLFNILKSRNLEAAPMPWSKFSANCFTECTWGSLLFHAQPYSPYGLGFKKEFLFANGDGPAIYLSPELMKLQDEHVGEGNKPFHSQLYAFITPFRPAYAPSDYKAEHYGGKNKLDYSHEREWRVPHNLPFSYQDVQFVIVDLHEDIEAAPEELRKAVALDNWIVMSNYRKIEEI